MLKGESLILWGASVTERQRARPQTARARISNPVSGGQCHLILARFSLYVHKGGLKPHSFHFKDESDIII